MIIKMKITKYIVEIEESCVNENVCRELIINILSTNFFYFYTIFIRYTCDKEEEIKALENFFNRFRHVQSTSTPLSRTSLARYTCYGRVFFP